MLTDFPMQNWLSVVAQCCLKIEHLFSLLILSLLSCLRSTERNRTVPKMPCIGLLLMPTLLTLPVLLSK